jgi:nucleoside-diphosphate-sugar epimerase
MSNVAPLLVLGGTDVVGRFLVERTLARGPVLVIGRTKPHDARAAWREWDLAARPFADATLRAEAAIATLPIWLLAAHLPGLAKAGVKRLVAFSSTSIETKRESASAQAQAIVTALADGEATVTERCAALGIGLTILRPTLIYGLGLDRNVSAAARFIRRFGFFPVAWNADGKRQPVHAEDLATAALMAIERPQAIGKVYALPGGETLAYRAMIARIFVALGRRPRILRVPGLALVSDMARRMARDQAFDSGPAARDLDYAPRRFLEGGRADLRV